MGPRDKILTKPVLDEHLTQLVATSLAILTTIIVPILAIPALIVLLPFSIIYRICMKQPHK